MPPDPSIRARRLAGNPILHRDSAGVGRNLNGPSLIAAPPWLEHPLGRYYLYFAHHRGTFIRLATSDRLEGPWRVHRPGTLQLAESHFPTEGRRPHIASPDVHVDVAARTVRMYFHGLDTTTRVQHSRVALSQDGIRFEARPELLGRPYFRAFRHDGWWYALGMPGILYRSVDGLGGFERGPQLFERSMRHSALWCRGDELLVFWSRVGDDPERILCSPISLVGDWQTWRAGPAEEVLAPHEPWEGAGLPSEPSVRGWVDEPVCQVRDPAVFEEDGHTYLLYSVAGESGIAVAEIDGAPVADESAPAAAPTTISTLDAAPADEGNPGRARARRLPVRSSRGLSRLDPGAARLRQCAVTMAATLASFASALLIEHGAHLTTNIVILAVALALTMGRADQRAAPRDALSRVSTIVVLPLVAVLANEIGTRILRQPDLGDTLFVAGVSIPIWFRRFGAWPRRIATLVTLPLIATLIVPAPVVSTGSSDHHQLWWSAVVAVVAVAWVTLTRLVAEHAGLLRGAPVPDAPTRHPAPMSSGPARAGRRLASSTKMALQMAAALSAAFALGRSFFSVHWTWVVLTAFIVCSGNRGRGDVVDKAVMRLVGAGIGTLVASALASAFPAGDPWSIVAIFTVLSVALWLRALNYAYWAAGMTGALALLYGYYGEHSVSLLGNRLEAILVGAAVAVVASWLLFPVRTTDIIRRDIGRALVALHEWVASLDDDSISTEHSQSRFLHAVRTLEESSRLLRKVPRRVRAGFDHLAAVNALGHCVRVMTAVADGAATSATDALRHGAPPELMPAGALSTIAALRSANGARALPDPTRWKDLVDAVGVLADTRPRPRGPRPSVAPAPAATQDPWWVSSGKVLAFVNRSHGTTYRLTSALQRHATTATYVVADDAGRQGLLTWSRHAQADIPGAPHAARALATPPPTLSGRTPSGYPYRVDPQADPNGGDEPADEPADAVTPSEAPPA